MGFLRHRSRPEDDEGFSLVETIVAMVVLGSILLVTITVISTSFRTLGGAKETDVANNIGQARIEAARSLAFGDVGTVSGSPAGTITPSETIEIQGVDLQVDTTVQWVGSATGLDLVTGTQSGDGVPGFFDPGIDYKLVTVTVTPNGNDPIVFETIIAPPNVAASEDAANLIITIAKDEPASAPSDTSLPRVYLHPATGLIAGGLGLEEVPFLDIEDGVDHPIRLGPTINDTSDGTWAMADPTLSTSVGAATTSSEVLTIYRPITLEITATDDVGTLLADASVVVTDQATSDTLTLTPADMSSPGVWAVTELVPGVPLKHGDYSYVVSAPGHVTSSTVDVPEAPVGYPLDLVQRNTVPLTPATTTEVTVNVEDARGTRLHGATILVEPATGGDYSVTTGEDGSIVLQLENDELHDLTISSPYGHTTEVQTAIEGDEVPGNLIDVVLTTPSGSALYTLEHDSDANFAGVYQYRPKTSAGDDWLDALANADGDVSIVASPHTGDGNQHRWEARVRCDDGTTGTIENERFRPPPQLQDRDDNFDQSC